MHIASLVEDVVVLVLQRVYSGRTCTLAKWKEQLPILAVCRQWRKTLMPFVYGQVLIEFTKNTKRKQQLLTRQLTAMVPFYALEDNAELIVSNSGSGFAKSLHINVDYYQNELVVLRKTVELMELNSIEWNIKSLTMSYSKQSPVTFGSESATTLFLEACMKGMPLLSSLTICAPSRRLDTMFYDLVAAYADNLTHLNLDGLLRLDSLVFLPKLQRLDTSISNIDPQSLFVCIDSLKMLNLYHVGQDFTWECFAKSPEDVEIKFSSLLHLRVNHSDNVGIMNVADRDLIHHVRMPYRLNFPSLKTLELYECPPTIGALHESQFPKSLKVVKLSGHNGDLMSLDKFRFAKLECLQIEALNQGLYFGQQFFDNANHLFSNGYNTKQTILTIKTCFTEHMFNLPKWKCLSRIVINNLTCVSSLVEMVSFLPEGCEVDVLHIDEHAANPNIVDPTTWASATVLATCIKAIRIAYNPSVVSTEKVALLVVYLMVRIKSLPLVIVPPPLLTHLDALVVDNMDQFPYLLGVDLKEI